ncbi:MAG: beta-ketoacyl-ACP synthase [Mesosutterella sp.]|nr:beta-ketoacyl-ACP synthase [Mesosutterella sp.]
MTPRRVVVTGGSAITAFGSAWEEIKPRLQAGRNAVRVMEDWGQFKGLNCRLGAPVENFTLPEYYTRKKTRSMGRVAQLATRSAELALAEAGLSGDPVLGSGRTGVAYGSCVGCTKSVMEFGTMLSGHSTASITGTSYVRLMPHTTAVNISLFFGLRGRVIPTSSACTSGSQAIGYAWEAVRYGLQDVMVAGGSEELTPAHAAAFDTLFAASVKNDTPELTPAPFDKHRDGLVIGEGAGTLILESLDHAKARGARIWGEITGFATNCDASHVTNPNSETMRICMHQALESAGIAPSAVSYINGHGTGTVQGDRSESLATAALFGSRVPFSTLKGYFGHTLGACGGIEAWLTLRMMNDRWFAPTVNLREPDPECGELDFIIGQGREIDAEYAVSNNFAFGGVNTSLVFRRWA